MNKQISKKTIYYTEIHARKEKLAYLHVQDKQQNEQLEVCVRDKITPEYLLAALRHIEDEDTVFINELISSYEASYKHLRMSRKGSIYGSGAGGDRKSVV